MVPIVAMRMTKRLCDSVSATPRPWKTLWVCTWGASSNCDREVCLLLIAGRSSCWLCIAGPCDRKTSSHRSFHPPCLTTPYGKREAPGLTILCKECPKQGPPFGLRSSLSMSLLHGPAPKPLDIQGPPDPLFTLTILPILASCYSAAPKLST